MLVLSFDGLTWIGKEYEGTEAGITDQHQGLNSPRKVSKLAYFKRLGLMALDLWQNYVDSNINTSLRKLYAQVINLS